MYRIWKDRRTGEWMLQWRNNDPIPHYSFADALESLGDLLRLNKTWKQTARGNHATRGHRMDDPL